MRATTKKAVNFLSKEVHPRQNPGYAYEPIGEYTQAGLSLVCISDQHDSGRPVLAVLDMLQLPASERPGFITHRILHIVLRVLRPLQRPVSLA